MMTTADEIKIIEEQIARLEEELKLLKETSGEE